MVASLYDRSLCSADTVGGTQVARVTAQGGNVKRFGTVQTAETIADTRSKVAVARARARPQGRGAGVGFVPTMGALHDGHRSLIRRARRECDYVVVSIFVNPMQFEAGADLDSYPRTLDADLRACRDDGVDLVFLPSGREMYPEPTFTRVRVRGLTESLCGRFRPGHFDGVCTVVAKLFGIVAPDKAYFGEKDYQQLLVVQRMVRDLNMPVEIVACPLVRESDGLACSSRNAYLSPAQRRQATCLHAALTRAAGRAAAGCTNAKELTAEMERVIHAAGPMKIDYAAVVDPRTLRPVTDVDRPVRLCLAVRIGDCRLIDNLAVDAPPGSK